MRKGGHVLNFILAIFLSWMFIRGCVSDKAILGRGIASEVDFPAFTAHQTAGSFSNSYLYWSTNLNFQFTQALWVHATYLPLVWLKRVNVHSFHTDAIRVLNNTVPIKKYGKIRPVFINSDPNFSCCFSCCAALFLSPSSFFIWFFIVCSWVVKTLFGSLRKTSIGTSVSRKVGECYARTRFIRPK